MAALFGALLAPAQTADGDIYFVVGEERDVKYVDVNFKTQGSRADVHRVAIKYAVDGRPLVNETKYVERPESGWGEWSQARFFVPKDKILIVLHLTASEQNEGGRVIDRSYGGH
jgi:hypothetical protein